MVRWLPVLLVVTACSEYDFQQKSFDDFFEQEKVDVISDVLIVVDNSASMAEEQERLQANFGAFMDAVGSAEADYQVGVVTTDTEINAAGKLIGGIFDPSVTMVERQLSGALMVGTNGSRNEAGLEAAALALDGRNTGFPREGAMVSVIIVSDEDDDSPREVQTYTDMLATIAGDAEYGIHGIVGDLPEGCATGTSAAAPGPRYIEAIRATGGHRASICADDYSELLERVGLDVAGLPDTFELSQIPAVDTIKVFVDDVLIPERDIDGWTYDPGHNAIVFHGRSIPRPGMLIGVNYSTFVRE